MPSPTTRAGRLVLLLAAAIGATACQSTYDDRFRFQPHPAERSADVGGEAAAVRMLASVIGVRNADRDSGAPRSVEIGLRVENRGGEAVAFLPDTLELLSGDLAEFGEPIIDMEEPAPVPPGGTLSVRALFPMPQGTPDDPDLSGLSLRWALRHGERQIPLSVTFTRRPPDWIYEDRYRDPSPNVGVGIGIGTRF